MFISIETLELFQYVKMCISGFVSFQNAARNIRVELLLKIFPSKAERSTAKSTGGAHWLPEILRGAKSPATLRLLRRTFIGCLTFHDQFKHRRFIHFNLSVYLPSISKTWLDIMGGVCEVVGSLGGLGDENPSNP
jgi:hypothetical protein